MHWTVTDSHQGNARSGPNPVFLSVGCVDLSWSKTVLLPSLQRPSLRQINVYVRSSSISNECAGQPAEAQAFRSQQGISCSLVDTRRRTTVESAEGRNGSWRMARTRDVGLFRLLSAPGCISRRKKQASVLGRGVEHEGLYLHVLCGYFYVLCYL